VLSLPKRAPAPLHRLRAYRSAEPQVPQVQATLCGQLLDSPQSHEPRTVKVLCRKAALAGIVPDLLNPLGDGPLWPEGRHVASDLGEVDLVVASVGPGTFGEADGCSGDFADLLSDGANLYHIFVAADIECLVVDDISRRFKQGEKGARDVLDVNERPPRGAIGLETHPALREGGSGEVVDHDVGSQSGRRSVSRGVTQISRTEVRVRELG